MQTQTQTQTIIGVIIFIALLIWLHGQTNQSGGGATSPGTLIQLVAKGAQDVYLTGYPDYWKYGGYGYGGYGHGGYGYGGYGYPGPISPHYYHGTHGYYYPYGHLARRRRRRLRQQLRRQRRWWHFWN